MTFWPVMKLDIGLVGLISLKQSMLVAVAQRRLLSYLMTLLPVMKLGLVGLGLISLRTLAPVIPWPV